MPAPLVQEPPTISPSPEQLKLERRHSRKAGLFEPELLKAALKQSLVMLRPDIQWKNPVMFVVEVGSVLTIIYTIAKLLGVQSAAGVGYLLALDFWLVATLLFANFASGIAEARGKAQADALRKTRRTTPARRLKADGTMEETVSTELRAGDRVEIVAGEVIPSDGEIVEGVASIDESAITGESAPVIREAGGDRSGVTGGTRVLSDRIVVEITAGAGSSFLDRMIALVEGAIRQRTPNEIALSIVLAAFTLIFLIVTATLWPIAYNVELYMTELPPASAAAARLEPGNRRPHARGPAGLPDSHHDRRPAGRHRHRGDGPGPAGQHHGQERQGRGSGRRHRHAALGQDGHDHHRQPPGDPVRPLRRIHRRPGRATGRPGIGRRRDARGQEHRRVVPQAGRPTRRRRRRRAMERKRRRHRPARLAVHRLFGPDADERHRPGRRPRDPQGAPDAIVRHVQRQNGLMPAAAERAIADVAGKGATPLLVSEGSRIAGMVVLEDILKPGIAERFARLRRMGLRTVMVTGDNPLTAAAIAAQAGVDDYLAEATPEAKLAYIRKEQASGKLVAMMGDGTNDAPALAQADVGVAMNSGTQAAKEAGNMVDLDSDPTKLIETVEIGKQLLMTRGALTTFSIANDLAKYFAIVPALFAATLPWLKPLGHHESALGHFGDPLGRDFQRDHYPAADPHRAAGREVPARRGRRLAAPQPAHLGPGRRDRTVRGHQADRRNPRGVAFGLTERPLSLRERVRVRADASMWFVLS